MPSGDLWFRVQSTPPTRYESGIRILFLSAQPLINKMFVRFQTNYVISFLVFTHNNGTRNLCKRFQLNKYTLDYT